MGLMSPSLPSDVNFSKDEIRTKICELKQKDWIELPSNRAFRDGGPGNYFEDFLGIQENNLQIADLGIHELKSHRKRSESLNTLKSLEPGPGRRDGLITKLIEDFGFPYNGSPQCKKRMGGKKCKHRHYDPNNRCVPIDELSLDGVDMCGKNAGKIPNPRGFYVTVNKTEQKVVMHFDPNRVKNKPEYLDWLATVKQRRGNLDDIPDNYYWSFDRVDQRLQQKIQNMVFIKFDEKGKGGKHLIKIDKAYFLENLNIEKFLDGLENGEVYIETRAHGTRNHGTAFRMFDRYHPSIFDTRELID